MFGPTLDYYLLKAFTHKDNIKTEDELDQEAMDSTVPLDQDKKYLQRLQTYYKGQIPIDPNLKYLDIGSGIGRLSFDLILAGAHDVTGVEMVERYVIEAQKTALQLKEDRRPAFFHADIHEWPTDYKYDVIFGMGAMEHIANPAGLLKQIGRLLKPSGLAFLSHAPFQSPLGDHMQDFFKIPFPWRGLLFSEKAMLRLRKECYRPTDCVESYQDIIGGLNLLSYSQYLNFLHAARLKPVFHTHNPQFWLYPRHLLWRPLSLVTTRIPKVRDYFIMYTYGIFRSQM